MGFPEAALIEIIERVKPGQAAPLGIIVPNEVRINGTPLLAPAGQSVKVHEIEIDGSEAVLVTLTLFARRVTIAHEEGEPNT